MTSKLRLYLAGAIRDDVEADITWRETMIDALGSDVVILNPLGGKRYDPATRVWTFAGAPSAASLIVAQDFWCVDRADIVVANLGSLAEGYPSIGTLMELGRASARGGLVYAIVPAEYPGHQNKMFRLHPFIERISAAVFPTVAACRDFLVSALPVLAGTAPRFLGAP